MALPEIDYMEYSTNALACAAYVTNSAPTNLLTDGGLETWDSASVLHNYDYAQDGTGGSLARESTTKKVGTYSAKITKSNSGGSAIYQTIAATAYRNKTVTVGCWVKSANTYAELFTGVLLVVYTDLLAQLNGVNQTDTANWQFLSCSIVVGAAINNITIKMEVTTNATAVAYFDSACMVSGSGGALWDGINGLTFLQSFSENTINTQGSYSLKGFAGITDSANKTLTRTL